MIRDKENTRNKTPGGVFIHLLKSTSFIPEDMKTIIFKEEKAAKKKEKELAKELAKLALL